jgi:hypothetical protein
MSKWLIIVLMSHRHKLSDLINNPVASAFKQQLWYESIFIVIKTVTYFLSLF